MQIKAFYDESTATLTYVVYDPQSKDAIIIDPVLDYDPAGSTTSTASVDAVLTFVDDHALRLRMVLETHAHADHLSGSQRVKRRHPEATIAISRKITVVQEVFKDVFDLPDEFPVDGRQFDRLLDEGEHVQVGTLAFEVIPTPGHTPVCTSFLFDEVLFTGDAMFMPDMGTGRCDFPGGSASDLYDSIVDRIYALPDSTRIFVGHDYQPGGRPLRFETTVKEQKENNVQLPQSRPREEFIRFRSERDATLNAPRLLFQSIQVNVAAGKLPSPASNELRYLRIPINAFRPNRSDGDDITEEPVERATVVGQAGSGE